MPILGTGNLKTPWVIPKVEPQQTHRVEVKERIYTGIDVQIGSEKTRTKREHGPSKVRLLDGKIRIDPL